MLEIPNALDKCGMNFIANEWRKDFSEVCVNDLKRAAKIINRIIS